MKEDSLTELLQQESLFTNDTKTSNTPVSISQAYDAAVQLQLQGKLQETEVILREILKQEPEHALALHLLGIIIHQSGKTELAVQFVDEAIKHDASIGLFHSNRCEMSRLLGDLDTALIFGKKAVELEPSIADTHCNLGIIYYERGEYEQAEKCQIQALSIQPDMPQALNNLGSIYKAKRDWQSATKYYQQVLKHHPGYVESMNNLAALLIQQQYPEAALELLLAALKQRTNYAEAYCNAGNALLALDRFDEAAQAYQQALQYKPQLTDAMRGMANFHLHKHQLAEAMDYAEKAQSLEPGSAEIYSLIAQIHSENGLSQEAESYYNKALAIDKFYTTAITGLAQLMLTTGNSERAVEYCQAALKIDPYMVEPLLILVHSRKVKPDENKIPALQEMLDDCEPAQNTLLLNLHFALGKCYDDIGEYVKAFSHFQLGCQEKRKRINYDATQHRANCQNVIDTFSKETIATRATVNNQLTKPVFIIGMPRSGTTLTEQILASHPDVYAAGELSDLANILTHSANKVGQAFPEFIEKLTEHDMQDMANNYIGQLTQKALDNSRYITDKMPANFLYLGLIYMLFPQAKVIHVKRHPLDTCLSIYSRLFRGEQLYSYDLTELGLFYCDYSRLMEHWRSVLPENTFLDFQYEELVNNTVQQTQRLLEYCELPWDNACLDFYDTDRHIKTASFDQVRKPIYGTSIGRWQHYEKELQPLLALFKENNVEIDNNISIPEHTA